MFGSKPKRSNSGDDDRLAEWQRAPSVPVTKPTGLKTRLLLANLGRDLRVMYRKEPLVIRPISVFRKPAYNRMYVEAEHDGETKIFNISDLLIRRPDSDSYYDDEPGDERRSSVPFALVLLLLVAGGAAAAVYFDLIPVDVLNIARQNRVPPEVLNPAPNEPVPPAGDSSVAPKAPSEKPNERPPREPAESPMPATPPSDPAEPSSSTEDPTFGREFRDASGSFRVRAEFVEFQPDRGRGSRVILRKADGSQVDVAMNRLSKDDQAWIRDEVKRRREP